MPSLTVVKDLNIFKYRLLSLRSGLKALIMNLLGFQGMKNAFQNRVIPTVAFAKHALLNAVLL